MVVNELIHTHTLEEALTKIKSDLRLRKWYSQSLVFPIKDFHFPKNGLSLI
jgi:hypothetical protein